MNPPDFKTIGFYDAIASSAREMIISSTVGWILSDDSGVSLPTRLEAIKVLTGKKPNEFIGEGNEPVSISFKPEKDRIDIFLEIMRSDGTCRTVAIENKIKAFESRNQLANYDERIQKKDAEYKKEEKPKKKHKDKVEADFKVFLTLVDPGKPSSEEWHHVRYRQLVEVLNDEKPLPIFAQEFTDYIKRLCWLVEQVEAYASSCSADGPKDGSGSFDPKAISYLAFNQKLEGDISELETQRFEELRAYIVRLKLRPLLQRAWMNAFASQIQQRIADEGFARWKIDAADESHGAAILNVKLPCSDGACKVHVGIQAQNKNTKVFSAPNPYTRVDRKEPTDGQLKLGKKLLEGVRKDFGMATATISNDRGKGFRSFSYKEFKLETLSDLILDLVPKIQRTLDARQSE